MMNKKIVVGILAMVVLLMTVQGIRPVLAANDDDNNGSSTLTVGVGNGKGTVCWSGYLNGCTQSITTLTLMVRYGAANAAITFTAYGDNGYKFNAWQTYGPETIISLQPGIVPGSSMETCCAYVTASYSTNSYSITTTSSDIPVALFANFNAA